MIEIPELKEAYSRRRFKEFLTSRGYEGRVGGWIYDPHGDPIAHGYFKAYANHYRLRSDYRDWLADKAGVLGFESLLPSNTLNGYRPTIFPESKYKEALADEYDAVMKIKGFDRRAFRGQKVES